MTTRTRPSSRRFRLLRFALLLGSAWFGTTGRADADVAAVVVNGELRVTGDGAAEQITLRIVSSPNVNVYDGPLFVGSFAPATFASIRIDAGGGNDTVTIDESGGTFTDTEFTTIFGGDGNDTINGGSGGEFIHGGPGADNIDAGPGNDTLWGDAGNDTFLWRSGATIFSPSDGSDAIDGGDGADALDVTGTSLAEAWGLAPDNQRAVLTRSGGAITIGVAGINRITVAMLGGDDTFTATPGLPALIALFVDGGAGNDQISGSEFGDTLSGGDGDDAITGGPGNDVITGGAGVDSMAGGDGDDYLTPGPGNETVLGGAGNDQFVWEPGDGFDDCNGEGGVDAANLTGDDVANDLIIVSGPAAGGFVLNFNGVGSVTCLQVEDFSVSPRGGNDSVNVTSTANGRFQHAVIELGNGSDNLYLPVLTGHVFTGGGAGQDTLNYSAQGVPVDLTPTTISVGGIERVGHHTYEQVNVDNSAGQLPQLTITTPTTNPSTTSAVSFMALGGTASDADGPVQSVTWVSSRGYSGTASGTTAWTIADVPLQHGTNVITVSAHDASGNSTADSIMVTVSTLTYLLAEGASGSFFDLDVLLANPTVETAPVTVTFLRQSGPPIVQSLTLAPTSRHTIHVDQVPGLEDEGGVSTVVASTAGVPIVVERSMFWDQSYYGSHGGTAVDGPRTRWLFAEGSEGFFNTFVLLANPGASASASTVTLTFLREGSTPFVHQVTVQPNARVTVAANAIPELVGHSFSIVVDATSPIIAERAMYFGAARLFDGGHESTGVPEGAQSWFLAEGATGPFFETFVLIGNPNSAAATVTVTFLTDSGLSVVRNKTVPANGRLTINIEAEDPQLANVAVSTAIVASQPVVVERAMYWPGPPSTWAEAHNSFGATFVSAKWGLAEGRVGMAHGFETYILLANPNTTAAEVRITFLRANGSTVVKTFTVAPASRFNVAASSAAPELQNEEFGALIEVTNGLGIGVERAMYSNALGQTWAAGTNALATRLP